MPEIETAIKGTETKSSAVQKITDVNEGFLRGTLLDLKMNRSHTVFTISVNTGNKPETFNILDFKPGTVPAVKVGDKIDVKCHLEINRIKKADGSYAFTQLVVADSVKKTARELAYRFPEVAARTKGGGYPSDRNVFYISGTFRSVRRTGNETHVISARMRKPDGKHLGVSISTVKNRGNMFSGAHAGDHIMASGYIYASESWGDCAGVMFSCRDILWVKNPTVPD